jgi:hypothetical protein
LQSVFGFDLPREEGDANHPWTRVRTEPDLQAGIGVQRILLPRRIAEDFTDETCRRRL